MKTAMQELKEILENAKKYYSEIKEVKKVEAVEDIIMVVDESLKAEKEQIMEAFKIGELRTEYISEQYYTQTYNIEQ